MTTFKVITLGCKVNQYESAFIHSRLLEYGWHAADRDIPCDVTVVNTCIVTQRASHQSRQEIRKAVRENPSGMVAAIGCYPQVFPHEIAGIPGVRLVAGNTDKPDVPDLIKQALVGGERLWIRNGFAGRRSFAPMPVRLFPDRSRAFLKIQDGCEGSCSFCIVPRARGPYRSLPPSGVLTLLKDLSETGYREVVLTGIHLGKYGADLAEGRGLVSLLDAIGNASLPLRVRLSSIEPNEIEDSLIDRAASEPWLCRHFHVPLQSGDERTLLRMNRRYGPGEYGRLIEKIRQKIPLAAIGADVMAGFPGEDPAAHENTLALIGRLPLTYLHVFPYSRRPGTAAAGFRDHLPPGVIKERASRLRTLGLEKKIAFYDKCLGHDFEVLVEGWEDGVQGAAHGTTDNYLSVIFNPKFNMIGKLTNVTIESRKGDRLLGRSL